MSLRKPRPPRTFTACRADKNQPAIVSIFRILGCTVTHLHMVGDGCPDIVVGIGGTEFGLGFVGDGINILVEIKDGSKPPSRRTLTEPEKIWHATWKGQRCIIKSPDEAAALVASVKEKITRAKELGLWPLTTTAAN